MGYGQKLFSTSGININYGFYIRHVQETAKSLFSSVAKKKPVKKKTSPKLAEENELLKLKMMAEFGGNFISADQVPAELENKFLKQIINFHRQHGKPEKISIYQYIGQPEYNHVHDLSDKQIKKELKKLQKLLVKHGIGLDVWAPTPDKEIYRFITEELFKIEIDNVKMKGWMSQFVYEDFHPNAEYDIKYAVHHIITGLFDSQGVLYEDFVGEELKDSLGLTMDIEELKEKTMAFRQHYHDVILVDYEFISLKVDNGETTARVVCDVTFKTQKEKGKRTARHVTSLTMYLHCDSLLKSIWKLVCLESEFF